MAIASGTDAITSRAAAIEPPKRPIRYAPFVSRVLRRIGAKPVSSSRITVPATIATRMKMPNTPMIPIVCTMANGELTLTLPRLPIWIVSTVVAPNASRKNSRKPTQNTGLLSW